MRPIQLNDEIAGLLEEVSDLLRDQGAGHFRVQAYLQAASALRGLRISVGEIFAESGLTGLEKIPGIGESIARSIRDILLHGKLAMLERLRGEHDPIALLRSVPGIGQEFAWRIHEDLHVDTLEELEAASHDGRLEQLAGFGRKRLAGIRDSLAHRLGQVRREPNALSSQESPSVEEILDVDREYRDKVRAGKLSTIAPRRFNPDGRSWLPVLHTNRADTHYTALFSNTARAHQLLKTKDWVVVYYEKTGREGRCTIITSEFGFLQGRRIVRGREQECFAYYRDSPV